MAAAPLNPSPHHPDRLNLNLVAEVQILHGHHGSCGPMVAKDFGIHRIHAGPHVPIGDVQRHLHALVERTARGYEHSFDVAEALLGLFFDRAHAMLGLPGHNRQLTGDEDEAVVDDAGRIVAARWGRAWN